MLALAPGEVHLWLSHYAGEGRAGATDAVELLSDAERARMARFRFERDRRRFLRTRVLVRETLSRYADVPAACWEFVENPWGRPAVSDRHGDARELSFNVSHTDGLIALGVARNAAIGVDAERVVARASALDVATSFFSAAESAELAALDGSSRQRRFLEYWTLRESYLKARGTGLSTPLDRFAFSCSGHGAALEADADLDDDPARWWFRQLAPTPEHVLAVCVEKRGGRTPRLLVKTDASGAPVPVPRILGACAPERCSLWRYPNPRYFLV